MFIVVQYLNIVPNEVLQQTTPTKVLLFSFLQLIKLIN